MKTPDEIKNEEMQARFLERKRLMQKVSEAETAHEETRHNLWIARQNLENYRNGFRPEKEADNETL